MPAASWAIRAVIPVFLLTGCAGEPSARRAASPPLEEPRLSAFASVPEAPDRNCAAEAAALDRALGTRASGGVLEEALDRVATCRHRRAEALISSHRQGRITRPEAAAALIGLRGAMRRDAARIEIALFNQPGSGTLLARSSAARDRLDSLVLQDG